MTKEKFPIPAVWLNIAICEVIYKAYKTYASEFGLDAPMPSFDSRYENRLESILGSTQLRGSLLQYDIVEVASCYFVSLSKSQVFFDANKRMAVVITNGFLILNGYRLKIHQSRLRDLSIVISKDKKTNIDESVKLVIPLFEKAMGKI